MLTDFWSRVIFDRATDTWMPAASVVHYTSTLSVEPYYRPCVDGAYSYYASFPRIRFYDRVPSSRTLIEWRE